MGDIVAYVNNVKSIKFLTVTCRISFDFWKMWLWIQHGCLKQ